MLQRWHKVFGAHPEYPMVVSFYTDAFYLREAFELARSCEALQLDYDINQVRPEGSWARNTNLKPSFLQQMSLRYPDRAIVWLDADARVRALPTDFPRIISPVAYHVFKGREVLSGTVLLKEGALRTILL